MLLTVVMLVLIWKRMLPLKNTAQRILASLCNLMTFAGIVGQVKILDLGDALHIFQHLGNQPLVGIELPLGKTLLRPLHGGVDGEEQQKSSKRNQSHTPVKEEHHDRNNAGGQKSPSCDHDHAGGDIRHIFHGVGGDRGDLRDCCH